MREQVISLYTVSELSEKAQEHAYYKWLEGAPHGRTTDNEKTLERFEEVFQVKVYSWSYGDQNQHAHFKSDGLGITGDRLRRYVINHYHAQLHKGKYYSVSRWETDGKYHYKHRHSKVIQSRDCVLTGYYMDTDILDPVYDFMDGKRNFNSFDAMIEACLEAWLEACAADYEDMTSRRAFLEEAEANNYEYLENGTPY